MDADVLERALSFSEAEVCILRWMKREQLQATLVDGVPGTSSQVVLQGIGCRSYTRGRWGFASTTDGEDLEEIIRTSERIARYKPGNTTVSPIPAYRYYEERREKMNVDEFFEMMRDAYDTVKGEESIVSCRTGIMAVTDEKVIVTSDGVSVKTVEPRILGTVLVTARSGGKLCQYNEVAGGEYTHKKLDLCETAQKAIQTARIRLFAKSPPSTGGKVLLGGEVVGLLIHEAVGHAAEADIARRGSFLSQKIGERIASPSVTVVDDGTYEQAFGSIKVDDEGVQSRKTTIIEEGFLKTFLHSRETGVSTGNARAWLYSREPQVRMTNTFLSPGEETFEELLEAVRNGLYLTGSEGGNANPDGNFVMIPTLAQRIEKGELTDEVYTGPVISGDALRVLQGVTGVGDEDTFVMVPSICGKGGSAFVGQGGPAVVATLQMEGV